ncbi:uncharacterized protein [Phyllobates terribilis]|uniref:uncharacterized protein isoform X2 n=1 Tax=Phyllobates terribilis TaxID=111132 RepID=UPI003CCAD9DC
MRKPQPFTIGTRLSTPKCPDVSASTTDATSKSWHIGERVSHYLAQYPSPSPAREAAHSPVACVTDAGSLGRSISKIALSREAEGAAAPGDGTVAPLQLLARTSLGNCNNNNSRGLERFIPEPPDFPCKWSMRDPRMIFGAEEGHKTAKGDDGERTAASARTLLIGAGRSGAEPPDTTQLLQEIQQAESWARCKRQDLTDGGDAGPPTLIQRDIQAFEGKVMKLSQMADHMCSTCPPTAADFHSQLQALRDQWQLLKEAAANQSSEVGGASGLQEFNKKADELEMWMRQQEETPPLRVLLDQNLDKVQISRKILDLKQEQIHYCRLQESVSMLAQKLEKQGRPESKTASARRKHLTRMWRRLQTSLHEHEQSLQLALEAASLWHQADAILQAVEEKSRCAGQSSRDDGDQDLRAIAGQIMMLDVAVSQVSNLHPLLSSRALLRHRQVKDRWAQLHRTLRTVKTSRLLVTPRDLVDPLTVVPPEQSSVGNLEQVLLGDGGPAAQTDGGLFSSRSLAPPRSQGSGRCLTDAKRSLISEPQTNHKPQNGHPTQGPPETPEIRHLLRELGRASRWLHDVELLLSEPTIVRSPEPIRKDMKKVSLLEREARTRGSALQSLRGIAKRWAVTEEMEQKVQEVEERCQGLQDALRRRVSDLRDTLVLSEFMKVVQMEEERKKKETMSSRGAPRGDTDVPSAERTETFSPLEELQEAVEMLNDAVKERERALAATREAEALESRVSAVSHMMAAARIKLRDVQSQLEAAEKEFMTARTKTELADLQRVISQQQRMETDISETIKMEVKALEEQWEALPGVCPARSLSVSRNIEDALRTWTNLQTLVHENKMLLQRMALMREFLLRYLNIRSGAEVSRGPVLSGDGGWSAAQREELERTMRGKRKAFEALAGIGWKLIGEDHRLLQMVQERLEEVQGLLIRWRCWKQQRIVGNQMPKAKTKETTNNMEAEKDIVPRALEEFECAEDEDTAFFLAPIGPKLLFQPPSGRPPMGIDLENEVQTVEEGPRKFTKGPLWLEPKNLPAGSASPEPQEEVMLRSPHTSFWRRCQGFLEGTFGSLKRKKRVSVPVLDEVSTYLNTKEETKTTYQSLTVPRVSQTTFEPSSGGLPKIRSNTLFRSLLRKEKAQRCTTIQGIMGLCSDPKPNTKDIPKYQTSTWPPKQNYVENPLSKDIDAECGSGSKKLALKSLHSCPHLTIGRVLNLQISKEPHILENIQDAITVLSVDDSCSTQNLYSEKTPEPTANEMKEKEDSQWSGTRAWLDAITSSSGYCRQNIHGYGRTTASTQNSRELEDFIDNFEIDRLSPLVLQHLDPDWDPQEETMNSLRIVGADSSNCDDADSQCYSGGAATLSSAVLQNMEETSTKTPIFQETGGKFTTSSPVLQQTGGTSTTSSAVHQEMGGTSTTSSAVLQEMGGTSTTASPIFQETAGTFSTSSPIHQETAVIYTTSFPILQKTKRTFTTSSPVLQQTGGTSTTSSAVLQEMGGTSTTVSPIFQETAGIFTTSSPVLHETAGTFTTSSPIHQETKGTLTTSSPVLHETVGTFTTVSPIRQETSGIFTTSSPVLHETVGTFTTSSPIHQETKGTFTTSSPVLHETVGTFTTSSPVFHETVGTFTTSSLIQQETAGTSFLFWRNEDKVVDQYCVKKNYGDGQRTSMCPSSFVLHTPEPHHNLSDPYNLIETPPDKGIFTKTSSFPEVLHPDHEFLENDDEELEGIWNNAKKVPVICPVQASHHIASKGMVGGGLSPGKHDSHRGPYGQVVTGTKPNILVATFTLPSSTMRSTELATEKRPNTWREKSEGIIRTPANWCPEYMSKSRTSTQAPLPETVENTSIYRVTRKLDFHLMEGPLERKPVLQVGGRKASSRTWGTFYAVLVRRTLCFYHDPKYPTKSSASASPLHLSGAVCTPESDYTKRDNCFRLRLLDASEYLFRAPTPESLHQWLRRLRHNSGMDSSDLLSDVVPAPERSPRIMSGSLMPDLCQSIPAQATDKAQVARPQYWKETANVKSEVPKLNCRHHVPGRSTMSDNDGADPENNSTTRRRSQSFSSARYHVTS